MFGIIVILIGVLFLLQNLGILPISWNIIWPVVIILIGISMTRHHHCGWKRSWKKWYQWDEGEEDK